MAEVLLFHHVRGRTPGVLAFAEQLRQAGHTVQVPDLFDGRLFGDIGSGVDHVRAMGFQTVIDRGVEAAAGLPEGLVYAGISLGVLPAQALAQNRPGARGAVLLEACIPPEEFGAGWPDEVPVQVHGMDADPSFALEGDLDAARELVATAAQAELFTYPGDVHLFTDASLESHDPAAAALVTERVLAFLATR